MAHTKEQPRKSPVRVYFYRAPEKDQRIVIVSNGRSTAAQVAKLTDAETVAEKLKAEVEAMEAQRRKGMIIL